MGTDNDHNLSTTAARRLQAEERILANKEASAPLGTKEEDPRTEEELRESEERFRLFMDHLFQRREELL